jgi:hypothetical protein
MEIGLVFYGVLTCRRCPRLRGRHENGNLIPPTSRISSLQEHTTEIKASRVCTCFNGRDVVY